MLLAIQLYREMSDYNFHPFTQSAYEKLESYVESKRQLTKESHRHFVEHAYNQFFVHPAFLESARSRTRAKDIGASEPLGTSTKLEGYVWIQGSTGTKRIPKSKVEEMDDDVPMPDPPQDTPYDEFAEEMKVDEDQPEQQRQQPPEADADADQEEVPNVPLFEVKIREPKDTRSLEEEKVSKHKEGSEKSEESYEQVFIYHSAEDRFGQFIMSHFSEEDQTCWKQLVLCLRNVALNDDEEPTNLPQTLDEVSPWSATLMMEVIASEQFHTIMETWQPAMGMEISYDNMYELRLAATKVKLDTQDIHLHHFEEDAKPELPRPELEARYAGDPEFREREDLVNKPNNFAIEGEDDTLVDLTVQWLSMFNQATMKVIMNKMIKEEHQDTITLNKEEVVDLGSREDDEDITDGIIHLRNDDGSMISPELAALFKEFVRKSKEAETKRLEEEKDPVLPPPEHINQHLATKEKEAENKPGSSLKKEEPSAPARSSQKEASSAKGKGSKKPQEPKPKLFYVSDISGCEEDSVLRTLRNCFPDSQWEQWCGFYNRGYPQSEKHKHMFWHTQYRRQDIEFNEIHEESWHQADEYTLMDEYIARFKDQDIESELEELRTSIAFGCSDPRLALRIRAQVERLTEKAEKKLQEDWDLMDKAMAEYIQQHKKVPYCSILQSMAIMSFLGAGAVSEEEKDPNYPYRSGKTLSCMFWNMGHWCRQRFSKYPLPTQLEKYQSYVDVNIDLYHQKVDLEDRPVFNNSFVTAIKNLGAHIFLNREASTIFPYKEEFLYGGWTYACNDYHDLLCMARVGKGGYVQRIAGWMTPVNGMYHGQSLRSSLTGLLIVQLMKRKNSLMHVYTWSEHVPTISTRRGSLALLEFVVKLLQPWYGSA
eukprot:s520_g2.t1